MRITAGTLRGRRLNAGRGRKIRPTSGVVREAIFNLLLGRIQGAEVLDLFAGAGALGIEALSRGARLVVFVDSSKPAMRTIERNLEELGLEGSGRVFCCDAKKAMRILSQNGEKFQIIFLDPPYGRGLAQDSLQAIAQETLLSPNAIVVVEHGRREQIGDQIGILRLKTSKRYGDTQVSVFTAVTQGGTG